jgi:hypothetical protein
MASLSYSALPNKKEISIYIKGEEKTAKQFFLLP